MTAGGYDAPPLGPDSLTWRYFGQPKRMLMHPRKRSAFDRATGRLPADSPLVETPARNLSPVEYRGQPQFYCPNV